jgi:adenosylhomocysteine nucleosidase
MKALVVFPLQEELDFFLAHCRKRGLEWSPSQIGRLAVFKAKSLALTVARGGTGKAQFALQTQHLLDSELERQIVICAGAAGALVDGVTIGDVVVATVTVEHDYRNRFNVRPLPRFEGNPQALEALRQARPPGASFGIHFGPVASGDEDIMTTERRQQLHEDTGGLAAAWEGAGGARACAFSGTPFIEIRGVTDAANTRAAAAFEDNLEMAMGHVTDLIITWLERASRPI